MRLRRACCHPAWWTRRRRWQAPSSAAFLDLTRRIAAQPAQGAGVQPVPRPSRQGARGARRAGRALSVYRRHRSGASSGRSAWRRSRRARATLFLISLRPAGTGLNLTAADYVIHLDPVVEPGRGRPGVGPRAPHRPATAGDGLPAGGGGQHRGAHSASCIRTSAISPRICSMARSERAAERGRTAGLDTAIRAGREGIMLLFSGATMRMIVGAGS